MSERVRSALLVASYGSSDIAALKCSLETLVAELTQVFFPLPVVCAVTSSPVLSALKKKGYKAYSTVEQLQHLRARLCSELVVLPTHLVEGCSLQLLKKEVESFSDWFSSIRFIPPLLSCQTDVAALAQLLVRRFPFEPKTPVVLVGHGGHAEADMAYRQLEQTLHDMGRHDMAIATLKGTYSLKYAIHFLEGFFGILPEAKTQGDKRQRTSAQNKPEYNMRCVRLAPLMFLSGVHSTQELFGSGEHSWQTRLKESGYKVFADERGLAEIKELRDIYIKKVQTVVAKA